MRCGPGYHYWLVATQPCQCGALRPLHPPHTDAPFPPRELRQCQEMLRAIAAELERWRSLGKGDGVHGTALGEVLYGSREESA